MGQPRDRIGRFAAHRRTPPAGLGGAPGMGNAELAEAMRLLRRSSAASPHDPRPNRERSRADARRAAIRREIE